MIWLAVLLLKKYGKGGHLGTCPNPGTLLFLSQESVQNKLKIRRMLNGLTSSNPLQEFGFFRTHVTYKK